MVSVPAIHLKQVKIHVETLHSTKVKEQNTAKKGKGKKGSTIRMDRGAKVRIWIVHNNHYGKVLELKVQFWNRNACFSCHLISKISKKIIKRTCALFFFLIKPPDQCALDQTVLLCLPRKKWQKQNGIFWPRSWAVLGTAFWWLDFLPVIQGIAFSVPFHVPFTQF